MKTKIIGIMDGFSGTKLTVHEIQNVPSGSVVVSHSVLTPSFGISLRVGSLRKLIAKLGDDEIISVDVSDTKPARFTFVK